MAEGKYIYCIIDSAEEKDFGPLGIGGRGDKVHSIAFKDIAAVVSDSPIKEYPISRENLLIHQKVMEYLLESYIVLPVKFGTVAKGNDKQGSADRIRNEVLKRRYNELCNLLEGMAGKIELGVKCLWVDMESIFSEIVEEHSDIKRVKERIAKGHPVRTRDKRITLGEKVKNALDRKREKEEAEILQALKPIYEAMESGDIFGDRMVTNTSFLVSKDKVNQFDGVIDRISSMQNGRMQYKYVGPVPPCNFVELTIILD